MAFFASSKSWKLTHIRRFEDEQETENYYVLHHFSANGNVVLGSLEINPVELTELKNLLKPKEKEPR